MLRSSAWDSFRRNVHFITDENDTGEHFEEKTGSDRRSGTCKRFELKIDKLTDFVYHIVCLIRWTLIQYFR